MVAQAEVASHALASEVIAKAKACVSLDPALWADPVAAFQPLHHRH